MNAEIELIRYKINLQQIVLLQVYFLYLRAYKTCLNKLCIN